jgi:hypothetical protein
MEVVNGIAKIAAIIAALWAIYVFFSNLRLQRAKWLAELYAKFYERSDLKQVREALDCEAVDLPEIGNLVENESPEFTDYLNFFEFVAVLKNSRQLTEREIDDLFGYYLDCLEKCRPVRKYIAAKAKGYEQLDKLLRGRAKRR